jgi:hypothetical protein
MKILITLVVSSLLLIPASAFAERLVGQVLIAKGVVTANNNQAAPRTLAKGSQVFLGETISTASDSFVVLKMVDDSKLSLRPKSEVTLEKFSQESGKEEALFDLLKGGLRALSGDIGKKRPEQYRVQTSIATIGIRGTDFLVRLCLQDCLDEDASYGDLPRQGAGAADGTSPTKRKELRRLGSDNNTASRTFIDCKPSAEIKEGLYTAVFDGKIWLQKDNQVIELEAVEAVFAQQNEIICMGDIPNFIMQDDFLSENPGETITLFNILKNIDEEQQRCEIPES